MSLMNTSVYSRVRISSGTHLATHSKPFITIQKLSISFNKERIILVPSLSIKHFQSICFIYCISSCNLDTEAYLAHNWTQIFLDIIIFGSCLEHKRSIWIQMESSSSNFIKNFVTAWNCSKAICSFCLYFWSFYNVIQK